MKTKILLMLMSLLILSCSAFSQQSISGLFNSNGIQRGFTGAIPNNPQTPLRLVILFHGTGENAYEMEARGFNAYLGNNTMVVYPNAADRMAGFAGTDSIDDYQMVEDLIDNLESIYMIDTSDICIGGFSSGAAFTYNLVCDFNDPSSTRAYNFKAFAIVSGFVDTNFISTCSVVSEVPLIAFHGTADQIALYDGGILSWVDSISAEPTDSIIYHWAINTNGCQPNPILTLLPDSVSEQFGNSYPILLEFNCPCVRNTKFYRIVQGPHGWPRGQAQIDFWGTNMDINASELIADFFDFLSCDSTVSAVSIYEENFDDQLINVYPIPTSDLLIIEGLEDITKISIYNVNGEIVKSFTGDLNQLNIVDLFPGLYFLNIESTKSVFTHKIVKH